MNAKFVRKLCFATSGLTKWANDLSEEKFNLQIFTSNGPTVIMQHECVSANFMIVYN